MMISQDQNQEICSMYDIKCTDLVYNGNSKVMELSRSSVSLIVRSQGLSSRNPWLFLDLRYSMNKD